MEAPAEASRERLDGQQIQRFETQIETFLTAATPERALTDEATFQSPVRQRNDRGGNLRAFGVWCQGDGYDLFIVQAIYVTESESAAIANQAVFAARAEQLQDRHGDLTAAAIAEKAAAWDEDPALLLFTPDDL